MVIEVERGICENDKRQHAVTRTSDVVTKHEIEDTHISRRQDFRDT